jgi:hypothetical protein
MTFAVPLACAVTCAVVALQGEARGVALAHALHPDVDLGAEHVRRVERLHGRPEQLEVDLDAVADGVGRTLATGEAAEREGRDQGKEKLGHEEDASCPERLRKRCATRPVHDSPPRPPRRERGAT